MTFAGIVDFLRAERLRQGRSQADVGRALGIAQTAVSQYESFYRRGDGFDWLEAWAGALGFELVVELRARREWRARPAKAPEAPHARP